MDSSKQPSLSPSSSSSSGGEIRSIHHEGSPRPRPSQPVQPAAQGEKVMLRFPAGVLSASRATGAATAGTSDWLNSSNDDDEDATSAADVGSDAGSSGRQDAMSGRPTKKAKRTYSTTSK
ncbi:hypothetical protein A1O1_06986 [Capronia coronata CBS 617.96]|uniref:Uncharacterized protein n=1 Tax=Capronia coronata CBS 617.96 TaxID=1182541 RepID=W9Y184_9EURO|nr:uncharacterized protein A1O1_06986 [Capronia coronata CBS 617.96]EXJ83365.1 hypothetical protein A1O1_06986 [Capronia coronata CBS 617.96]